MRKETTWIHVHWIYQMNIWVENMIITSVLLLPVLLVAFIFGAVRGFWLVIASWGGLGIANVFFSYIIWYYVGYRVDEKQIRIFSIMKEVSVGYQTIRELQYIPTLFGLFRVEILFVTNIGPGLLQHMDSVGIVGVKDPIQLIAIINNKRAELQNMSSA